MSAGLLACGHPPTETGGCVTGYAVRESGARICYDCAAVSQRIAMVETGRALLYLTGPGDDGRYTLTDWPGRLWFHVMAHSRGRHNIARTRIDVWFRGPDGFIWHGVQYGEWTQICHCKRTGRKQL